MKSTPNFNLFWPLAAAFVLFSAAAGAGWLYGLDVFLSRAARNQSSGFLDIAGGFLSALGGFEVMGALLLLLLAGLFLGGRQRLVRRLLLALLACGLLEYLLNQFLPVPPVPTDLARTEDSVLFVTVNYSYPYPSGHALRSTIFLGTIYLLSGNSFLRAGIVLCLLALLASRVYLGVHWTSDVVGGALLGATAVLWAFAKEGPGWR